MSAPLTNGERARIVVSLLAQARAREAVAVAGDDPRLTEGQRVQAKAAAALYRELADRITRAREVILE